MSKKVFISYCGRDGIEFAKKAKEFLEVAGHLTYFYQHDRVEAVDVWLSISSEIDASDAVLFIVTPSTETSLGQRHEAGYCMGYGRAPLILKHEGAREMRHFVGISRRTFTPATFEAEAKKVIENIERSIEAHRTQMPITEESSEITYTTHEEAAEDGLDKEIVKKYSDVLENAYFNTTVISKFSNTRSFDQKADEGRSFLQIYWSGNVPKEWFKKEGDVVYESTFVIGDIGSAVSNGEINMYRKLLLEALKKAKRGFYTVPEKKISPALLRRHVIDMKRQGFNPSVLLAPINHMKDMMHWTDGKTNKSLINWGGKEEKLVIDGDTSLLLYFSRKVTPFDEFIIIDPKASVWIIKPDAVTGKAITYHIRENELYPQKAQILIKTVATIELKSSEGIRVIIPVKTISDKIKLFLSDFYKAATRTDN